MPQDLMNSGAEVSTLQTLGDGSTIGSDQIALQLLESNFNPALLRTNAVLREDEWRAYDKSVTDVSRDTLHAAADLISAGLEYTLPNAMGVMELRWDKQSDLTDADIGMSAVSAAQNDRLDFGQDSMPIPIVHKSFSMNTRHLAAARNAGHALDTAHAVTATRKVNEKIDDVIFNGSPTWGRGGTVLGYRTAPNRNTGPLTVTWLTATGEQILTDTLTMITAAIADKKYGPYMMYVSEAVMVHLGEDYKANSDKTILQRLLENPKISSIKSSPRLPDAEVLMIQMTRDTVELINGMEPTMVAWGTQGGFVLNFRIISIMLPRIRSDYNGSSGIMHYSV